MKISVLADSIALPRGESWGDIPFESTYPFLLQKKFLHRFGADAPWVLLNGQRMRTTEEVLRDWFEDVELRGCEAVIIQVGGGDCAPRFLMPEERAWIETLPSEKLRQLCRYLERSLRSWFISTIPLRVCVTPEKFRKNLELILTKARMCGVRKVVFINVPAITDAIERELPGSRRQAALYNEILRSVAEAKEAEIIDLYGLVSDHGGAEHLTVDGTHLNPRGLEILADTLFQRFEPWVSGNL